MALIKMDLFAYINQLQPEFSGRLGEVQRDAIEEGIPIIPPETARLLSVLVSMKKPLRALEIGCAVGFSAGLIATHMADGGTVTTIDRYEFMITRAKANIERMGLGDRITLIEGDAAAILPVLNENNEKFDFIFLDAAKGQYLHFLPQCMELLDKGGVFVADDILQNGTIVRQVSEVPRRQRTTHRRMNAFLQAISTAEGLESSIIPIGDGLAVCVKTADEVIWKEACLHEPGTE